MVSQRASMSLDETLLNNQPASRRRAKRSLAGAGPREYNEPERGLRASSVGRTRPTRQGGTIK